MKIDHHTTLIGSHITIVRSANKSLERLEGKVVDETKHTIVLDHKGRRKTILKAQIEEYHEKNRT